ncbi:MAG: hypothetical protein KBA81_01640 [Rhabdochlamydiaceae bacterium]|jgi:hypothetical protein|nr:hypothetical protein [Rhabdochlamydiaceae bacterium]
MSNANTAATFTDMFVGLIFCVALIIIAIIKRKRQAGRRWKHPFSAKVKINDIPLTCQHCKEDVFYKREALIGSTLVTFFGWHAFNQSGAAYSCVKCGHLHWFNRPRETIVEMFHNKE